MNAKNANSALAGQPLKTDLTSKIYFKLPLSERESTLNQMDQGLFTKNMDKIRFFKP